MAYTYTILSNNSGDVAAIATELAQRQSGSGTNAGISGIPALPQLGIDSAGMGIAYLQAQADCILGSVGYQGSSNAFATSGNSSSTTYVDVAGFASYSFNAPFAKTYLLNVDLQMYCSVLSSSDTIFFQVVVGSTNYQLPSMNYPHYAINQNRPLSFRIPIVCSAGTNAIKLQWLCLAGTTTMNTNSSSYRSFTLTG